VSDKLKLPSIPLLIHTFRVFLLGFQNGGPAGLIYGYIFCFIGTLMVVASLGEMASMWVNSIP
jgi:hypothetical protein